MRFTFADALLALSIQIRFHGGRRLSFFEVWECTPVCKPLLLSTEIGAYSPVRSLAQRLKHTLPLITASVYVTASQDTCRSQGDQIGFAAVHGDLLLRTSPKPFTLSAINSAQLIALIHSSSLSRIACASLLAFSKLASNCLILSS